MKKYILQWSDNYKQIFQKTRLLSQIPVFILAVIAFFELGYSLYWFLKAENPADWVIPSIIRGFLLAILFLARFLLLFSKSKISFCISQGIWLIYFIALWNIFYFHHHPSSFELFVWLYLFGSLTRQIVSLITSIFVMVKK